MKGQAVTAGAERMRVQCRITVDGSTVCGDVASIGDQVVHCDGRCRAPLHVELMTAPIDAALGALLPRLPLRPATCSRLVRSSAGGDAS